MKFKLSFTQVVSIVVAVLVSIAVANYGRLMPHRWHTFIAADNSFSIDLPGTFTLDASQVPAEGGRTMQLTIINSQPTKGTSYLCSFAENEDLAGKPVDVALEGAKNGSLAKMQATLVSEKRLAFQGYPALEMQAAAGNNSVVDSRIIVAGKRFYMLVAASKDSDREPKTIQRMFDSLKLTYSQ